MFGTIVLSSKSRWEVRQCRGGIPGTSDIIREVKDKSQGQLHETVHRLVDADSAKDICEHFGISEKMMQRRGFGPPCQVLRLCAGFGTGGLVDLVLFLTSGEKEVVARRALQTALMMIGYWHSKLRPEESGQVAPNRIEEGNASAHPPHAIPVERVALALVIRSSKLGGLSAIAEPLSVQRVIDLISDAVYFRCVLPPEADTKERELRLTEIIDSVPTPQREHDVYLRLEIEDGGDLTDAESPFGLKNRLRDRPPRTIRLTLQARMECPPGALHDFHSI